MQGLALRSYQVVLWLQLLVRLLMLRQHGAGVLLLLLLLHQVRRLLVELVVVLLHAWESRVLHRRSRLLLVLVRQGVQLLWCHEVRPRR
jgi:hypothetical protein